MTVQFIEIAGERMAILPEAEFRQLAEAAEDAADIAAAIRAEERRLAGGEYVPGEMVSRMVDGEPPLLVWREYRGLSRDQLSAKADVAEEVIAGIEAGGDVGSQTWRALAEALSVDIEDIIP